MGRRTTMKYVAGIIGKQSPCASCIDYPISARIKLLWSLDDEFAIWPAILDGPHGLRKDPYSDSLVVYRHREGKERPGGVLCPEITRSQLLLELPLWTVQVRTHPHFASHNIEGDPGRARNIRSMRDRRATRSSWRRRATRARSNNLSNEEIETRP